MKLADTIQVILEIEGQDIFYSNVFINMLDDFGAFTDMPYAKPILKQMWDRDCHMQIAKNLYNESNLRYTINRIIDNLNNNIGFDRYSIITICNELLQGLNVDLSIESDNSAVPHEISYLIHQCGDSTIAESSIKDSPMESNFFIPSKDGNFVPLTDIPQNVSFNDVAKILGHDTNQYFSYIPYRSGIRDMIIMFESFTGNILYVYVYEKIRSLNASYVRKALNGYSFTAEYDYSKYCDDIEDGIKKGNLTKVFFKRLLNQDSDIMIDSRFNTKLIFANEKLVKMESMDFLSADALSFRDTTPEQYNRIKRYAECYNFSQKLISKEINLQVDAFMKMPVSLFDNFSEFYVEVNDEIWATNYVMCAIAYAKRQISYEEFKLISHEEYIKLGEFRSNGGVDIAAYLYLNHICLFDLQNGNFICCYRDGDKISLNGNINPYYLDKL